MKLFLYVNAHEHSVGFFLGRSSTSLSSEEECVREAEREREHTREDTHTQATHLCDVCSFLY